MWPIDLAKELWFFIRDLTLVFMNSISTSSYVALAGIIVSVLAHFNIIVGQDSIIAIIAGIVSLGGVISQIRVHKEGIAMGTIKN